MKTEDNAGTMPGGSISTGSECPTPESNETNSNPSTFGKVEWIREDLEDALRENGLEPTQERINYLLEDFCVGEGIAMAMVETGWIVIDVAIDELKENEQLPNK